LVISVTSVTIAADLGSNSVARALHETVVASDGDPSRSEADMRHITTTISGNHGTHDSEAALFWIFAGLIMVIAFGDAVAVMAVAVAIVTAVAWIYRKVERRLERNDAHTAPVAHLRPERTGQHDKTFAHAFLHRPHAA
jgi:Flp pilus assembly protein TadB